MPDTLTDVTEASDNSVIYTDEVPVSEGTSRELTLKSVAPAFTLQPDTFKTIVADGLKDRTHTRSITINGTDYTLNNITGENEYSLTAGTYNAQYNYEMKPVASQSSYAFNITTSSVATEYIRVRVKISDILPATPGHTYDAATDTLTSANAEHYEYKLKEDSEARGTSLFFVSGSVITAPIPDDEGYVDIYVDGTTGKYKAYLITHALYGDYKGTGAFGAKSEYMADDEYTVNNISSNKEQNVTFQAVDFPSEGINLMYVPAGEYTLEMSNVPAQYSVAPRTVQIDDSMQIQEITIVLGDGQSDVNVPDDEEDDEDDDDEDDVAEPVPAATVNEYDEVPKTGESNPITWLLAIALISGMGIVLLNRKELLKK